MRKEWIVLLIVIAALLSSCSASNEAPIIEPETVEEDLITPEASPREALFIYKDQQTSDQEKIELKMNAAPLLLSDSYVRLAGVVSGACLPAGREEPIALIEIGGRGRIIKIGDQISGYQIIRIGPGIVKLSKEGVN